MLSPWCQQVVVVGGNNRSRQETKAKLLLTGHFKEWLTLVASYVKFKHV